MTSCQYVRKSFFFSALLVLCILFVHSFKWRTNITSSARHARAHTHTPKGLGWSVYVAATEAGDRHVVHTHTNLRSNIRLHTHFQIKYTTSISSFRSNVEENALWSSINAHVILIYVTHAQDLGSSLFVLRVSSSPISTATTTSTIASITGTATTTTTTTSSTTTKVLLLL